MDEPFAPTSGWAAKFRNAFRGVYVCIRSQSSFRVHLTAAAAVLVLSTALRLSATSWSLLVLCIFTVLSAELFNSSLESLAKAVTREENPHVRDALDVASGAVLLMAAGAAIVGLVVLGPPLCQLLFNIGVVAAAVGAFAFCVA